MIGIDVGTKFIKVAQVDMRGGEVHDVYSIVKGVSLKEGVDPQNAKETILKNILAKGDFNTKRAAISTGCTENIIRRTDFPVMPEEEVKNSIRFNAEKYIFTDLTGMDMDISIIKKAKNRLHILVAAMPSEVTNKNVEIVQNAGYYAEIADIDILALVNCFTKLNPGFGVDNSNIVLVDSGYKTTGFAILNNNELCFAKTINFGGSDITSQIAKELDIKTAKAEKLKRNPDMWEEAGLIMKKILRKCTPDLIESIHRAIEYCRGSALVDSIDAIYMTGGATKLDGMSSMIANILGIETRKWNIYDNVNREGDKSQGPLLAVATGLALRDND